MLSEASCVSSLFVIQGRDQGKRFELRGSVTAIGRDALNRIRLNDTEVSRRHAELRCVADGVRWVDLGSSNGSFINSVRVDEQFLRSGDRIQVGRTLMIFTDTVDGPVPLSAHAVDIVGHDGDAPQSRIVQSISQESSSQFLAGFEEQVDSAWLARARSNLQVMYHTALAVSHTMDIDQLLHRIMELIFEWVEVDRGCIMLVDDETGEFVPRVRRDRTVDSQRQSSSDRSLEISRTILDYVSRRQEGVLTSDARDDERWDPGVSIMKQGVREAICVPMRGRYGVVGAIYIDTFTSPGVVVQAADRTKRLREEHLKLMVAIGHQAALAVEDTSYYSAMVQAERLAAMGQAIAGLSHHVKNILQGIRGGSFLIQEGLKSQDWELTQNGWGIVEKNQERISSLVMDMLSFSKEREPELVQADLNETVGDVLELMRGRAFESGVELIDKRDPSIPLMTFDPEGIHRAVLNVVTNAIDACQSPLIDDEAEPGSETQLGSPQGAGVEQVPSVEIETEYLSESRQLIVRVRDNGPGVAADQLANIFNMFVSSKGQKGTGLGLPVSQKILREHGGEITVESEAGVGSCFTLELPGLPSSNETGYFEFGAEELE